VVADEVEFKAILARKEGMTQVYDENGAVIPVTVLTAGPCVITQVKTKDGDGYHAVQLGFIDQKPQRLNKPQRIEAEKRGVPPKRVLREVRLPDAPDKSVGDLVQCDWFAAGDVVDVVGRCKGRGFMGGVRAWNFSGKRQTHGNMDQRGPGAIGNHQFPGRVFKGKKMATRWGGERITSKNHDVVAVQPETNTLLVRGSIPGSNSGLVLVRTARSKKYVPKG
jgi:large subunit ribosomal protein L3